MIDWLNFKPCMISACLQFIFDNGEISAIRKHFEESNLCQNSTLIF